MKRRILSLILAALLLMPTAFAVAASNVTLTSDDVRGNVGDTVTVAINIKVEPPKLGQTMDSLQFVLEYDSAALEFQGIQEVSQDRINILGAQFMCSVTTKEGAVAFTAAATAGATGSGVLMHVKFRILSAVSTMLVLKRVSYSFVTVSSGRQQNYTGGTVNLGRITGQSVPNTVSPMYSAAPDTQEPTTLPTNEPRFPVTEVTLAPGVSPSPQPAKAESDVLAYVVFGLFIVVAILICVVLTLMIVRRGQKARAKLMEDDEDGFEEAGEEDFYESDAAKEYEVEEEEEPPIHIVRRGKKDSRRDRDR